MCSLAQDSMYFWHRFRHKTAELESVRHSLSEELSSLTSEERGLAEYRAELDLLLAEKLRHVEQLRQIHSDINMVSGHFPLTGGPSHPQSHLCDDTYTVPDTCAKNLLWRSRRPR